MVVRFSIAPINWTNDDDPTLGGDISLEQCLTEMKEAGFQGCELGNKFPKSSTELAHVLNRFGLTLTTDWIGTNFTVAHAFDESLRHFRERAQFLKQFGVEALKVCEVGHSIQNTKQPIFSNIVEFMSTEWQMLIRGLHEAGKIANDLGMYISYHHHLGTGVQTDTQIDRLMHDTKEELVSLLPDTGHLYAAGTDPLQIFDRFRSRIKYIHLKDLRRDVFQMAKSHELSFMDSIRAGLFTVPSDGCIDFVSIFSLLKETKYAGWLVVEAEQDPKKAPPLAYAKKARDFLRKHFSC